jgi:hypothetical protein
MYFISYADILLWALKLSYPSDFLPFIFVTIKTLVGDSIDLQLRMEEMNLSEYKEHVVYNIVNATAERNEIVYACCPESYPDVTYAILRQFNISKPNIKMLVLRWFCLDRFRLISIINKGISCTFCFTWCTSLRNILNIETFIKVSWTTLMFGLYRITFYLLFGLGRFQCTLW